MGKRAFRLIQTQTQFGRILGAEGFNGADAVDTRWQRSLCSGTLSISVLPVCSSCNCLEFEAVRSRGLQLEIPDRISCEVESAVGTAQHQL